MLALFTKLLQKKTAAGETLTPPIVLLEADKTT